MAKTSSSFENDKRKPTAAEMKQVMESVLTSPVLVDDIVSLAEANLCPEPGSVQDSMSESHRLTMVSKQAKVLTNSESPYAQMGGHYLWACLYRQWGEYSRAQAELATAKKITMTGRIVRKAEALENARFIKKMGTRLDWLGEAIQTESSLTTEM